MWRWLAAGLVLAMAGCGVDEPARPESPQNEAAPAQTETSQPVDARQVIHASVLAVDLEGRPLANVLPIATRQSNAADKPVAQGLMTGKDGRSSIVMPAGERLYVRVWDPTLRHFANNYYEVLPSSGDYTELMTIRMVQAAALEMTLLSPSQQPAANENVGIMMLHPVAGAWWPGEGDTDAQGKVGFGPLPAGKYTIKLKAIKSGMVDLPDVVLQPGGTTNLGAVALRQ